mgnify:CR=1 FL=1
MTDRHAVEAAFPPPLPVELYAAPEGRPQLGSLLLRDGAVTLEQLEFSLAEKEASGGRLGEILLRYGYASGAQIARALAEQHGLDYLELGSVKIDPSATMLLPEAAARRLGALPVSFVTSDVVLIAVADPTDVIASDDLRLALGLQIRFGVVATEDLTRMIDRCYRPNIEAANEEPGSASGGARVEDVREGGATNAPAIRLAAAGVPITWHTTLTVARDLADSTARFPDSQRMLARTRRLDSDQLEALFSRLVELADEFLPLDAPESDRDDAQPYVFASFIYRSPRDNEADG